MLGAPAKAKDGCDWKTRTCFGINWKTAAPADVAGINVNSRNEGGDTPLHWAVENGSLAVVAVLLQVGPILMPEVMLLLIHLCFGRLDGMQISL
ncbi:MAG: ankyrin repeat domain-containing protein [Candidatus Zeuxoniibacter abyssi]|nr:MAG: ankyrin repeat domain-containing protein [Candidatus Persebacteraceae bacterium AB1(2)]